MNSFRVWVLHHRGLFYERPMTRSVSRGKRRLIYFSISGSIKQNKTTLSNSLEDQEKKLLGCEKNKYDIHIHQSRCDRNAGNGK